jgi:nicotinamide-nucleotide amidase
MSAPPPEPRPAEPTGDGNHDRVARIADLAREQGVSVAVAESLTAGHVSAALGSGEGASEWYRGAVVAYDEEVKYDVLGVTRGPVVTDACARQMAVGVRRLLGAGLALGITGVGGPGPQEGRPAGTVHLAVSTDDETWSEELHLDGGPEEVLAAATDRALEELERALDREEPEAASA